MRLIRNLSGISKLLLILLLVVAAVIGAFLSYLWTIGYYISVGLVGLEIPESPLISITNATFPVQNPSFFNVTIQTPPYELKELANITQITVLTEDGALHDDIDTDPPLPYKFEHKGELETFKCLWNWANYTGETVKIIAFIADGSGSTFKVKTPSVELMITAIVFSPANTAQFNVTLHNSADSPIDLNFTRMTLTMENGTTLEITEMVPSPPHLLSPASYESFKCSWNWTNYRGMNTTITVYTSQGYMAYRLERTSEPVILTISNVLFDPANMTYFNITVWNSEYSLAQANITLITVTLQNGTSLEVTAEPPPSLPYLLPLGNTVTFKCSWNWTDHRGESVIITVETPEGYKAFYYYTIS